MANQKSNKNVKKKIRRRTKKRIAATILTGSPNEPGRKLQRLRKAKAK